MSKIHVKIYYFFHDLHKVIVESQLVLMASSLSYMTTLALLPLMAFSFYLYKMFGGVDSILFEIQPFIFEYFAPDVGEQVYDYLSQSLVQLNFEAIGLTGLFVFVISGIHLFSSVENVVNKIWKVEKSRNFFYRWISYFAVLVIAPFIIAILFSTATISGYLPIFRNIGVVFFILFLFLTVIYKVLPHRPVTISSCLIASGFTSTILLFIKHGYAYYLQKALAYNTLYGSLAVLPIMQLWIYIIWIVILFGVILSEVINRYLTSSFRFWH